MLPGPLIPLAPLPVLVHVGLHLVEGMLTLGLIHLHVGEGRLVATGAVTLVEFLVGVDAHVREVVWFVPLFMDSILRQDFFIVRADKVSCCLPGEGIRTKDLSVIGGVVLQL